MEGRRRAVGSSLEISLFDQRLYLGTFAFLGLTQRAWELFLAFTIKIVDYRTVLWLESAFFTVKVDH